MAGPRMVDFAGIEKKWQDRWEKEQAFVSSERSKKKSYYVLEMYPYPSGSGLHMGHAFNYSIGDIQARLKRMQGFTVLYPMGFDSFGLPAENAAIQAKSHPKQFTEKAIENYVTQMKSLGLSYDWNRRIESHKPDYYKWDQWIFLKMLEKGLAYRKKAPVNWCSKCNTVLANEQVVNGKCWRHDETEVAVKQLEQWFLKTTAYADELLDELDNLDGWPEQIKKLQRNWIGRSEGAEVSFSVNEKISSVIFMHGKDKDPSSAWYPWLAEEIKNRNISFVAPVLPDANDPALDKWLESLDATNPDENSVLIGHSRGGMAILRWLERLPKGKKIKKVILLAANNPSVSEKNKKQDTHGFYELGAYDFEKIRSHCDTFVVMHSKDDKWVPFKSGEENAKGLSAKFSVYEDKGHFGKSLSSVPELVDELFPKWDVFTTRPDTLFGVTFLVVSAQHPRLNELVRDEQRTAVETFLKKIKSTKEEDAAMLEKEGVFTGSYAIHPLTGEEIPIWTGNFVLADYGSGMVMAVPAHDTRDWEFAQKYKLNIKQVVEGDGAKQKGAYAGYGVLINSEGFNGLKNEEAKEHIVNALEMKQKGRKAIQFRLKDWLISRQRFWGTPIPIVYCDSCGAVPVAEKDLPVTLPDNITFKDVENPLKGHKAFLNAPCPSCGKAGRRETDTMDTFVNSSWYFLRYCDPQNEKKIFDSKKANYWMPIDQYIGGKEHATLHLIYFRFYTKFLADLGLIDTREPATRLFNQGMLHGEDGQKMSKSKGNVVLPETASKKFGMDASRLFLVSMASPDKDIDWSDKGAEGSLRFVMRVMSFVESFKPGKMTKLQESKLHRTIKDYTSDLENFRYNLAVIKLRELFGVLERGCDKKSLKLFLKLFSVICPHISEELWEMLGEKQFVSLAPWPSPDEKKIDDNLEEQEKRVTKTIEDVKHILELIKEKNGADGTRVYLYVLPPELAMYNADMLSETIGLPVTVFAVNDNNKHDPEGKSKTAKMGRPGIYVE